MSKWFLITSFGTAAALFPLALVIAGWLAFIGRQRAAVVWLAMMAAGSFLVAVTKGAFIGWGIGIRALDFTCISGHSMLATSVYPVAATMVFANAPRPLRHLALAGGIAFSLLISYSRLVVHAHSAAEAVAGSILGLAIALTFIRLTPIPPQRRLPPVWIGVATLAVMLSLHQERLPTERLITRIALHLSGHAEPYVRESWLRMTSLLRPFAVATPDPAVASVASADGQVECANSVPACGPGSPYLAATIS